MDEPEFEYVDDPVELAARHEALVEAIRRRAQRVVTRSAPPSQGFAPPPVAVVPVRGGWAFVLPKPK